MNISFKSMSFLFAITLATVASAEVLDRPTGIKIGQRMKLLPYVSMTATYDSNVGSRKDDPKSDVLWTVDPNLTLQYNADNWALSLNGHYSYHVYSEGKHGDYNNHSYGQNLRWNWRNAMEEGAMGGWSAMLTESFEQITMSDDMSLSDGRGYSADRRQFNIAGAVQRRFNQNYHADINAHYYWLDYLNDTSLTSAMYGWQRWQAGLNFGYAPSPWTDFLANLQYQGYKQDNVQGSVYSSNSQGYSAMLGLGSFMTERISYRALVGWSRFEYANNASASDGFVYSVSGSWKISETWHTMLLASSYYQPSERAYASKSRVDSVSWGLAKSMIRGKLRATLDFAYRHTTNEHLIQGSSNVDYELDVLTGRIGFNYVLNRFLTGFAYGEYQRSWNDEGDYYGGYCDYDRFRISVGVRLTY